MRDTYYILLILGFQSSFIRGLNSVWHYECIQGVCIKQQITTADTQPLSLAECNSLCLDAAGLWPRPTGDIQINNLTEINIDDFSIKLINDVPISHLVNEAFHIFITQVRQQVPWGSLLEPIKALASSVYITMDIIDQNTDYLELNISENYSINVFQDVDKIINVTIKAFTFFGARHGLETLSQLIVYDDLRNRILLPNNVTITDKPIYPWRGITLDTSRNYITPKSIKKTLKAMAASKLNTLHWHLTDTASFPYVSNSHPELAQYGSYTETKVYDDDTVRKIVEFARVRGIRVVPELDAPAHVGEGWQNTGVLTCFNWHPWQSFCSGPPCGQLDPSQSKVYDILEDIYEDMLKQFGTEIFHMGGDEVNINCWNNTESLKTWMVNEKNWNLTTEGFLNVWIYFQQEAAKRLYKKAGKDIPVILWESDLTALDDVTSILPPENYIIQVWSAVDDDSIKNLLNKNYSILLSNHDALYLDCGLAGWVTDGNNWCSPYKGWQLAYDNKPSIIAGDRRNQVLGGEAALWSDQSGTASIDVRLWPRAAAFGEALWSELETNWTVAEDRMLLHRERLVSLGINADSLEPEWCFRNPQNCPTHGKLNV